MATLYHCIMCKQTNISVMDLHKHHIHHHTVDELSYTILTLQGLQKHLKPMSNDTNNNKDTNNHIIIKTEKNSQYINNQIPDLAEYYDAEVKHVHNDNYCLLNCNQFMMWEYELNKRTEICDQDFFNITEKLCNDLKEKKHRGRKRKNDTTTKSTTKNFVQYNENKNIIKTEIENIGTFEDSFPQTSTMITLFWNTENSMTITPTDNEILIPQIEDCNEH